MSAASERVFEFLEEEEEEQIVEHPADVSKITGAVTFNHVHFGYIQNRSSSMISVPA